MAKKKKNGIIKAFDKLPFIVKLILALPCLDVVWAIYRIVKGATQNNLFLLVVGILWIIPGIAIGWIVDLVSIILYKHPVLT